MSKENLTQTLIDMQALFEKTREGTDGTLHERNSISHSILRGIIGEGKEALQIVLKPETVGEYLEVHELTEEQYEQLVMEIIDVYIFIHSIFGKLGLDWVDVMEKSMEKMAINFKKYAAAHFDGRTVAEGMQWGRFKWNENH